MGDFRTQLQALLADRHTPEARALYELIARFVQRRIFSAASRCCSDTMGESDLDEVVADVMFQLVTTSLTAFRGETPNELYAFVRTVSDRTLWRTARARWRERETLADEAERMEDWFARLASPEEAVRILPDPPLAEADQDYLRQLLDAGSKVEHARRHGVSRAAVTQRVQRIQQRIADMSTRDQETVEAWLEVTARQALSH
ncbi:MAG: hypothetical protein JXX28_03900 [Deltaproteobacteria bacterium]|nr:hypothetical protein [Deltaproteobacteria bacterium]